VGDKLIGPTHAWRHSFKRVADRCGISEKVSDYITGHANKSVARGYGAPTLEDMAEALKKFPRWNL
jgi:integrase